MTAHQTQTSEYLVAWWNGTTGREDYCDNITEVMECLDSHSNTAPPKVLQWVDGEWVSITLEDVYESADSGGK